jgi:hypothetical protein
VPGSDPRRALELATRVAPLRFAAAWAAFVAAIEPSEHRYHHDDVVDTLDTLAGSPAPR